MEINILCYFFSDKIKEIWEKTPDPQFRPTDFPPLSFKSNKDKISSSRLQSIELQDTEFRVSSKCY